MTKLFGFIFFLIIYLVSVSPLYCQATLEGDIYDTDHTPLPGAHITINPIEKHLHSNQNGHFHTNLEPGEYTVKITFIGMKTVEASLVMKASPLSITYVMEEDQSFLQELNVEGKTEKTISSLASEKLDQDFFESNIQNTFVNALEKIAGISAMNVGVGVAKPVIRGLSSNRIIVNQNDIKQEGQQWGSDHGLEIDPFSIEQVEVVKGPSTLLYGSDGLGGVINVLPPKRLPTNSVSASFQSVYKTNNNHWATSTKFGVNKSNYFVKGQFSTQDFGDYRVPADSFTYNTFIFPIYEGLLKNTAGRERSVQGSLGYWNDHFSTTLTASYYRLLMGFFPGAFGIPTAYSVASDGDTRNIGLPNQGISHLKLIWNNSWHISKHFFELNVGYQKNIRSEYSEPHAHGKLTIDSEDNLALGLLLQTVSLNGKWEYYLNDYFKSTVGLSSQCQENVRSGFEYLLPNFKTYRSGIYSMCTWEKSSRWTFNGGLRLDYALNKTDFYQQIATITDSNDTIYQGSIATDMSYFNYSASVGTNYFPLNNLNVSLNFGKSFRVPYPNELVSNGVHHGTFRHERGNPELMPEHGYQVDITTKLTYQKWYFCGAAYFNFFDQYIYLRPTPFYSDLPEGGQVYEYTQHDAIYTGFELEWRYQLLKGLMFSQSYEYLWNRNLETYLPLPFSPPPSILSSVCYDLDLEGAMRNFHVALSNHYYFPQNRVDRNELKTPGYSLMHFSAGCDIAWSKQLIKLNIEVQNLFNTTYLNHLSRYRILNLPEQGRNIILSIKMPLQASLLRSSK